MSVVVGYVATPEGGAALDAAVAEAEARKVPLVVILSERSHRFGAEAPDVERHAEELRTRLAGSGVEHEVRVTGKGNDVAEEIIGAAEASAAHLIVIGLRRRSPVGKLLLGSNAQRILLDAPCPVLAVKPPVT
ncbi:universal stress protein [Actinotalea ferrariae]|uniref:universal stress protein n=1 Tax=Actinotalea ferrariae TaxID=1386098 RepID=UPI001C8C98A0|nr:universal stress protein [Actinotalea ferrariae]MBX9245905.1 universal stress protein [Actinotalea ferrariae]